MAKRISPAHVKATQHLTTPQRKSQAKTKQQLLIPEENLKSITPDSETFVLDTSKIMKHLNPRKDKKPESNEQQ